MTKGLLTHFSTATILHLALLLGGAVMVQSELKRNNVPKFGDGHAIQIHLGSSSASQQVSAPKVMTKPTPKVVSTPTLAKTVVKAPEATQKVVTESTPSEVSTGSSIAGTGGNPNGHALGSGSTGTGKFDVVSLYKAELRAEIDKNKSYPPMSKRLGQTGTVVVAFTLLPDGNITNVRIDKPSQFERLNASALEAVKKVVRFKPIPKEAGSDKMDITVPLKFVTI